MVSFRLLHLALPFKLPLLRNVMPGYAAADRAKHGMMMGVVSGYAPRHRSGDTADCMGLRREAHGRDSGTSHNHSAHLETS